MLMDVLASCPDKLRRILRSSEVAEKYFDFRIFWTSPSAKPPRGRTKEQQQRAVAPQPECLNIRNAALSSAHCSRSSRAASAACGASLQRAPLAVRSVRVAAVQRMPLHSRNVQHLRLLSFSTRYSRRSGTVRGSRSRCSTALFSNIQRVPLMVQASSAPARAVKRCSVARGRVRGWRGSWAVCAARIKASRDAMV